MATTADPTVDEELENRLDQLIPASRPSLRRLAISAAVVTAAIALTVLNLGGMLYPRPTDGGSFSSGGFLVADRDRGLVAGEVMLPNWSRRDVRVTDVALDAPGARLVEVRLYLEDEPDGIAAGQGQDAGREDGRDDGSTVEVGAEPVAIDERRFADAVGLPAEIPAGRTGWLVLWFEPLECTGEPGRWGLAEATLDFGPGAFPPLSRTITIDDPITEDGENAVVSSGGQFLEAPTALAAACDALS